jgi:hypothetical protein
MVQNTRIAPLPEENHDMQIKEKIHTATGTALQKYFSVIGNIIMRFKRGTSQQMCVRFLEFIFSYPKSRGPNTPPLPLKLIDATFSQIQLAVFSPFKIFFQLVPILGLLKYIKTIVQALFAQ